MEQRVEPRLAADSADRLGESPQWDAAAGLIWWVDFYGPTLHRLDPATGERRDWTLPGSTVGAALLAGGGTLLVALDQGLCRFDAADGSATHWLDPEGGREGVGLNDAKLDRQGRLWIGSFDRREREPRGLLHRIDRAGRHAVADSGFVVCNGPAFSPDGRTLYFSDTLGRRLLAYPLDPASGQLGERRLFATIDEGHPDGLTVDAEGFVWCAHYGGGRLSRFAPDGALERQLLLPVSNPTSLCFGGPELATLYVTTARDGADPAAEPLAGGLLAFEPGVRGIAERRFG
jgi:sugar lactone lactonase YvrE